MHDPKAIAEAYLDVWNEADASRRSSKLERGWSPHAQYVDPMMQALDRDHINAMIETARGHFPGHAFALDGKPDGHSNFVRFSWILAAPSGPPVLRGTDVVRLARDGLIEDVIGFVDETHDG